MLLQTSRQGLPWHKAAGRGRSRLKGPRRPFKRRALAQTCTKYGREGEGPCLARPGLGKGDAPRLDELYIGDIGGPSALTGSG